MPRVVTPSLALFQQVQVPNPMASTETTPSPNPPPHPPTGQTMRVHIYLQLYASLLPRYLRYDLYTPDVHPSPLVPILKLRITQEASEAQARMFRWEVYGAKAGATVAMVAGLGLGLVLMGAGLVMQIRRRKSKTLVVVFTFAY